MASLSDDTIRKVRNSTVYTEIISFYSRLPEIPRDF